MDLTTGDDEWLSPGLDLSSLRISGQLGRGGFASCWRATYNGQQVALKVMMPRPKLPAPPAAAEASTDEEVDLYNRMFLREAQVTSQLEHKHLVKCLGVAQLPAGTVPKQLQPALAMMLELCEPYTLKDLITKGMAAGRRTYKVKQAYLWLHQIASALAHLHRQKPSIIHRDIKPENILIKRDGAAGGDELICKVSDLGLHAEMSEDRSVMLRCKSRQHGPPAEGDGGSAPSLADRSAGGCRREISSATVNSSRFSEGPRGGPGGMLGSSDASVKTGAFAEGSPFLTVSTGPSFCQSVSRTGGRKEQRAPVRQVAGAQEPTHQPPYIRKKDAHDPGLALTAVANSFRIASSPLTNPAPRTADMTEPPAPNQPPELPQEQKQQLEVMQKQESLPMMLPLPPLPPELPSQQQQHQQRQQEQQQQQQQQQPKMTSPFAAPSEQAPALDAKLREDRGRQEGLTAKGSEKGGDGGCHVRASPLGSALLSETQPLPPPPAVLPLTPSQSTGCQSPLDALKVANNSSPGPANGVTDRAERRAGSGATVRQGSTASGPHRNGSLLQPPVSPNSPKSPAKSATLSTLLARHPDLVEPVPHHNPSAGLRQVSSLLRQLGKTELMPLKRHEMEWVYGLTGKAGSFMYMAPEVYQNHPYNEKSDVFSFGVLAYELLASELLLISIFNTGRAARLRVSEPHDYAERVASGYRPPRIQALSNSAWALIESCWHPDPVQRPTMAAVEERLATLVAEMEQSGAGRRGRGAPPQQHEHQHQQHRAMSSGRARRVAVGSAPTSECLQCAIC